MASRRTAAYRPRQRDKPRTEDFIGQPLSLVAADGFKLGAYRADPAGKPKGGVVVIQEIFE
jgi:hypothetical protein